MVNSWSLLYDTMYGPEDEKNYLDLTKLYSGQDDKYELTADGFVWPKSNDIPLTDNMTNIFEYPNETVNTNYMPFMSEDKIEFNLGNRNGFWKYSEDKILKQLEEYIASTYSQHYVDRTGGGTEQTLDKIKHNRREGFCAGNVTKYIDRYDTKGTPRADLFKVLHYTILLINHLNLIENN
jgi:hypothetical protein